MISMIIYKLYLKIKNFFNLFEQKINLNQWNAIGLNLFLLLKKLLVVFIKNIF